MRPLCSRSRKVLCRLDAGGAIFMLWTTPPRAPCSIRATASRLVPASGAGSFLVYSYATGGSQSGPSCVMRKSGKGAAQYGPCELTEPRRRHWHLGPNGAGSRPDHAVLDSAARDRRGIFDGADLPNCPRRPRQTLRYVEQSRYHRTVTVSDASRGEVRSVRLAIRPQCRGRSHRAAARRLRSTRCARLTTPSRRRAAAGRSPARWGSSRALDAREPTAISTSGPSCSPSTC